MLVLLLRACFHYHRLPHCLLMKLMRAQAAEVDARMLGALLAGMRRALPYLGASDAGDAAVGRHADALFRMLHVAPFGVRVQALALLQQLLADRGAMSDRFYRSASPPSPLAVAAFSVALCTTCVSDILVTQKIVYEESIVS